MSSNNQAQATYERLEQIKSQIKSLYEEQNELLSSFNEAYGSFELPIEDSEGKQKFFRVYEPEGRFVYNVKFEAGIRAKAQNLYEGENK